MERAGLLRFTTAGSVDDGKSTLIGRLLHDAKGVHEDQVAAVRRSGLNRSTGPLDFSLLTDGLKAEREQGITIDVAYRYFATPARKFIIADTPGHEQYTRNMATGASTADLAVILIDARHGVSRQSRRHACIAALLGIRRVVVAVNKMDLVDYSEAAFGEIRGESTAHLERLGIPDALHIPLSALEGDNVVERSRRMAWYHGPPLLEFLETVPLDGASHDGPLRFPVQYVLRPDQDFRGYAGQTASGTLRTGQTVMVLPSGQVSRIRSIPTFHGALESAAPQRPVVVCLERQLDISRGDMLVDPRHVPHVSRRFRAQVVWMHETALEVGREYRLKHTTQQVTATVAGLAHRLDVDTLTEEPAGTLAMNDIGLVELETSRPLYFDPYRANRRLGSFILIDPLSNSTVGAGMIEDPGPDTGHAAQAAALDGVEFRATRITSAERLARAGHLPAVVWLPARRGLAYLLEVKLFGRGCQVHVVASDTESRILPELAQLLSAAGLITIISTCGMDAAEAERARDLVGEAAFLELAPEGLPPSDDAAALQVCRELETRGLIPGVARFRDGEGI